MITEYRHENGLVELVVENPPVNAFSIADIRALTAHLRSYTDDTTVHAVLLRSEGRGFCGGGDVKEVQGMPGFEGILGQAHGSYGLTLAIADCPVPVVAAVHQYCIGIGVLVAGVCDIVLASPGTSFVLAEADNGATSGPIQAIGLIPDKRLRAAMFTCEPIFAEELHQYGSILAIVEEAGLVEAARSTADTICAKRPNVIRGLKASMAGSIGRDIKTLYRQELSYTYELNMSGDATAARGDFVDGRRQGYRDRA
ncbi:enoyl-CoA hydratase [Rhodococcus sp. SC4]|nr:enoyl-CoA hydratase [Rhodococcus sp. SC4]